MTLVQEFMDKMETPRTTMFWRGLVDEEGKEVVKAFGELLKELADFLYVTAGFATAEMEEGVDGTLGHVPEADVATAILGEIANAYPTLFHNAFLAVHRSNLSKLGDDGKPVRREDGKIMKGPNYKAPDMVALLNLATGEGRSTLN